jgi:hypothetical protein
MKKLFIHLVCLFLFLPFYANGQDNSALDEILAGIQQLEGARDPKCYASAARLEDFMYGTALSDPARFQKNKLQKRLADVVWRRAKSSSELLEPSGIEASFDELIKFQSSKNGDFILTFPNELEISLNATDIRQYGTVAYSLRAILAVQQDALMNPDSEPLKPLTAEALEVFKEKLDLATLALLQESDAYARAHNEYEISLDNINRAWLVLFELKQEQPQAEDVVITFQANKPPLLDKIIQQKVASYAQYNQVSNQLFIRNMQVYFARLSWPTDEEEAAAFKRDFIEVLIGYGIELYKGVVEVAAKNGEQIIGEEHVSLFVDHFTPFSVNEYEDITFFPNLPDGSVTLESYDLDAFRDSGVHWVYLGYALDSPEITRFLEIDPFAAELLAENMAQFGVLILREAGLQGAKNGQERLSSELLVSAVNAVQEKIAATVAGVSITNQETDKIRSTVNQDKPQDSLGAGWFTDITQAVGIDSMHRSSDWLNRLLRSYLRRDEETGIITIPPAFGGSGVAAEDINNDGYTDVLILSGLGNKLFINNEGKGFIDHTAKSGISYIRSQDNQPGEPRQPLIADLDNDGWQDIVITYVDDSHRVYRNKGDGTFEDMTEVAALGGKGLVGGPATVFDFDNDGLLDIYVTYFGDYIHGVLPSLSRINHNGLPNKMFKNMGDFKFKEVDAGVEGTGWSQAVTHTDFNVDNLQDLIVGNDFGSNVYYQNKGDGSFQDVTAELGTGKPSYTMNLSMADLNGDQLPDIYVSNIVTLNKDEKYVLPNEDTQMKFNLEKLANLRVQEANDLFISSRSEDGSIKYKLSRELVGRGYNSTGWSWGADFFDADMDGDDDLYVLNGMNEFNLYSSKNAYANSGEASGDDTYLPVDTKESNVFFVNSDGKLNNVSLESGLNLLGNSRSAAYLDFDNDGDLDIILNNYHEKSNFFLNNANMLGTNWLKLHLQGDPAQGVNRDAIGARVIITLPDGQKIWREIHGSEAYMTAQPKMVHAGLGKLDRADVLIVWPGGKQQKIENIKANQTHVIKMDDAANP